MKIPSQSIIKFNSLKMEIKILDKCEAAEWDSFVSTSPNAHFMQSYAWGELQRQSGWTPHLLMIKDKSLTHCAVLLLSRPIPFTGKHVFYAPRGPVIDFANNDIVAVLRDALMSYLNEQHGVFLRMDPYVLEDHDIDKQFIHMGFKKVQRNWSYWNGPRLVFWLNLPTDEESLFQGMASKCRNEVRAGYRKGIVFGRGGAEKLDDFYRLMVSTGQQKHIAVHDSDYYKRLYEILNRSAQVELFFASFEEKVIATGMSVKYGTKAWLLYAASDPNYYKLRPNRTLQWEMIKWAHSEGCLRYDFRGTATSDPPNVKDPGYGVYEFKKSFGPQFTRLIGYYDLVANPFFYELGRLAEEKVLPVAYKAKTWMCERSSI
jgi:peptidoglycan pentaglycine glycine transferase (the first glycine)